jgi:hypothetical protein
MTQKGYELIGRIQDRVIEECSELIKAIIKAERFGYENFHPDHPDRKNWTDILREIDDVMYTCHELDQTLRKDFSST